MLHNLCIARPRIVAASGKWDGYEMMVHFPAVLEAAEAFV
jgi:hypothetical protein